MITGNWLLDTIDTGWHDYLDHWGFTLPVIMMDTIPSKYLVNNCDYILFQKMFLKIYFYKLFVPMYCIRMIRFPTQNGERNYFKDPVL